MTEWLHHRQGWPLTYPRLGKAPAEVALGLLYLLRTDAAHRRNEAALEAARAVEQQYLAQLRRMSFGH